MPSSNFSRRDDYVNGINYRAKHKKIEVAVFRSKEHALKAQQDRINDVASVIFEGDDKKLDGIRWWWTSPYPTAVSVHWQNAIITVSYNGISPKWSVSTLKAIANKVVMMMEKVSKEPTNKAL